MPVYYTDKGPCSICAPLGWDWYQVSVAPLRIVVVCILILGTG